MSLCDVSLSVIVRSFSDCVALSSRSHVAACSVMSLSVCLCRSFMSLARSCRSASCWSILLALSSGVTVVVCTNVCCSSLCRLRPVMLDCRLGLCLLSLSHVFLSWCKCLALYVNCLSQSRALSVRLSSSRSAFVCMLCRNVLDGN